jgi:hypothetical protein
LNNFVGKFTKLCNFCIFKTFSNSNADETKEKPNLWKKAFCQIGVNAGELNDSFFRDP